MSAHEKALTILFCNVLYTPPHLKSQYMILIDFLLPRFFCFMINSLFIRFLSIWRLSITIFRGLYYFSVKPFLYTELAYRCNLWPYQLIVFVYYCDKWPAFWTCTGLYGSHKDRLGPAPINWQFLIINSITTIQVLDRNLYPYAYLSLVYGLWIIIPTERGPFYCYLGTDIFFL